MNTFNEIIGRRRALQTLGAAGAVAVTATATQSPAHAAPMNNTPPPPHDHPHDWSDGVEPDAGNWLPIILGSVDDIAVPPPPSGAAAQADVAAVLAAAGARDADVLDGINYWDAGPPGFRWNQILTQVTQVDFSQDSYRVPAYVNIAIYDATLAVWAAKYEYGRKRPSRKLGHGFAPAIQVPNSPSYPSEHGAAAGAAAAVLSFLFPGQADMFEERAAAQCASRIAAGVEYPSDIEAGLAIGRAVADEVITVIQNDGFPGVYEGDPELPNPGGDESFPVPAKFTPDVMVQTWTPIIITDVTEFRPPPPFPKDSPERAAELEEVRNYDRKGADYAEGVFWPMDPAGRPEPESQEFFSPIQTSYHYAPGVNLLFLEEINAMIHQHRWDSNPPRAARAHALTAIALFDSYLACWEAKYHYMVGRPVHFDPTLDTAWLTYSAPAYPSGHATNLTATATVLGYLFPREAHVFLSRAKENGHSRLVAGIHFRSDYVAGVAMGQAVGQRVIEWASIDGSS
jgi:membrane-associated phospholipid phosphatase